MHRTRIRRFPQAEFARVHQGPVNQTWGLREFYVDDPNGNTIRFGQPLKAVFKKAWGYQGDAMNLPVKDIEEAIPFYENKMGFEVISRKEAPVKSVILGRDQIQIALIENGGDPTQDGSIFEADNVEAALLEMKSKGLDKETSDFSVQINGGVSWKVFYIVAPDGLCYCIGERQG